MVYLICYPEILLSDKTGNISCDWIHSGEEDYSIFKKRKKKL